MIGALFLLAGLVAPASNGPGDELRVEVHGLRNARGQLLVALFDAAPGFPDVPAQALRTRLLPLRPGPIEVSFLDLPPGTYAVSLVHDENGNEQLDKNFIGIPREGFGTSNNVRPTLGAPKFAAAQFAHTTKKTTLRIELIYY